MKKRRTLEAKIKAEQVRQEQLYSWRDQGPGSSKVGRPTSRTLVPHKSENWFGYDLSLIYGDLRKTIVVAVFIFILLGVIAYFS